LKVNYKTGLTVDTAQIGIDCLLMQDNCTSNKTRFPYILETDSSKPTQLNIELHKNGNMDVGVQLSTSSFFYKPEIIKRIYLLLNKITKV